MTRKKPVGLANDAELAAPETATIEATEPESKLLPMIPESLGTTRATRRNLVKIQEKKFLEHAEPMLDEFFKIVRIKLRRGDPLAMKIVADMNNLAGTKGPSVVANIFNQQRTAIDARNEASQGIDTARSFEALVKKLDARDVRPTQAADFIDVIAV